MQAVILKKIPIREYDELVVCYTKDAGKQVYQAKGILQPMSKQAGHLDVLNLVDFSLVHKNSHPIITSAFCVEAFPHMRSSLSAMAVAFFLLECFDKLIFEGQSDPKLWNFLLLYLRSYDKYSLLKTNWFTVSVLTRREILKILGYDSAVPIEQIANAQFKSPQFIRKMLG